MAETSPTRTEVTRRYIPGLEWAMDDMHYVVVAQTDGYQWVWRESGKQVDSGPMVTTISEALEGAAADWDTSGDQDVNLHTTLRRAAAQHRRKEGPNR